MNTDGGEPFHLLLVEDDDGDAFLVEEMLEETGLSADLTRAWSLEAALDALTVPVDCVLLDLGLPDATGLDALVQLREVSDAALVVLTGLDGIDRGVDAVAAGAQDYLIKGRVDGESLGRAVRYAVERRRGERDRGRQEGAADRAERLVGLVRYLRTEPTPPIGVRVSARGDAGTDPLSTELWEVVERADGTILALFGTVPSAGTLAAAQAAVLRTSFAALALAGLGPHDVAATLDEVARPRAVPARAVVLELDPRTRGVTILAAGGAGPLLIGPAGVRSIGEDRAHAPLGARGPRRDAVDLELTEHERLLLLDVPIPTAAAGPARDAVGRELLDALAGSGYRVADDILCDTVARVLRSFHADIGDGHVALLGWAPG